jgi:hypothetical protein
MRGELDSKGGSRYGVSNQEKSVSSWCQFGRRVCSVEVLSF